MAGVTKTREQLVADFLELDNRFSSLVRNCSEQQLRWRPSANSWSIAECVEHVALVNSRYLPMIQGAIAGSRAPAASGRQPLSTAGWFSAFFLKSVSPQTPRKLKAPKPVHPAQIDPSRAFENLLGTHQQIRALLASDSQPDLNRLRFKNPFFPLLRFTVATGFLVMAAHGRRHLLQAEHIPEVEGFPLAPARQRA